MNKALRELIIVRFREFMREPEALFWVFIFPVLMAAGLGLAFRNRPAEVLTIGAVGPELTRSLKQEKLLNVETYSLNEGVHALRTGNIALLATVAEDGKMEYRYDDTNPEGRTARMLADRAFSVPPDGLILSIPLTGSCVRPGPDTSIFSFRDCWE